MSSCELVRYIVVLIITHTINYCKFSVTQSQYYPGGNFFNLNTPSVFLCTFVFIASIFLQPNQPA